MDALYRPAAAKPFVLEDFVLGMDTSVASVLTAETILKLLNVLLMSICLHACAWGQNPKFSGFSILATPTIEILRVFDDGHSFEQETR